MRSNISSKDFNIYLLYPINRDDKKGLSHLLRTCIDIGEEIRAYLIDWEKMDGLPRSHIYIPAEHELFISTAYKNKFITQTQILATNYDIIKTYVDLVVLFGDYDPTYENIVADIGAAKKSGVPIYTMPNLSGTAIDALKFSIKCVLHMDEDEL